MKRKKTNKYETYIKELEVKGYCIIPGILSHKQCDNYIGQMWDWLEQLGTGIDRNNKYTWNDNNWPYYDKGIIQNYRVGHAQFLWDLRCEQNIIDVYSSIWETDELLVSFDGMNVTRPTNITGQLEKKYWWHTDQSFLKTGRQCIQGFINLEKSQKGDACFCAIEGSHNYHEELFKTQNIEPLNLDWYELDQNEINWYLKEKKLKQAKVYPPKGSLVLWDSRTIHCNYPSITDNFRYVAYISMTPADKIDSFNLRNKRKAFYDLQTTTHWPHEITLFTEKPVDKNKAKQIVKLQDKLPELTEIGKKLAGLLPYNKSNKKRKL